MAEPAFITPPPGLIPEVPEASEPGRTVRSAPQPQHRPQPPAFPVPAPAAPIALPREQVAAAVAPVETPSPDAARFPTVLAEPEAEAEPIGEETTAVVRVWRLRTADGTEVRIAGRTVLGRAPSADGAATGAEPVAVDDPARSVSKTHALVEPRGATLAVTDLGSTNGVYVWRAGAASPETAAPGEPVEIGAGASLYLGELGFHVDRAPHHEVLA